MAPHGSETARGGLRRGRTVAVLLIRCPWCGPRDEIEFRYGGQAHVDYPIWYPELGDEGLSDEEWTDFLFLRDNPRGPFRERWCHVHGCRRWFNAVRDTGTHRFLATYRIDEDLPT
jgi:heterotetrameric sarcosine oxidase delta subunit